jgi:hypothetical protein
MKNLNPFKRDTGVELTKTHGAIAEAASKLATLRQDRAAALTDSEDLEAIRRADNAIADAERFISSLQERLMALQKVRRKEHEAERQEAKEKALVVLEKQLRAEADAAVAVVESFVAAANAFIRYKEIRSQPRQWSNLFPSSTDHLIIGIPHLLGNITSSFFWSPMQEHRITGIPKHAVELIERLRSSADRSIKILRDEPLPPIREPDDEAA